MVIRCFDCTFETAGVLGLSQRVCCGDRAVFYAVKAFNGSNALYMGMNPFERAAISGFYLILHCAVVLSSGEEVLVRPEAFLLPLRQQLVKSADNSS